MYAERFSELLGSDSKVAKKLVVKLYMEYQISMDEATVLTENKPVERPREVAPTQRFFSCTSLSTKTIHLYTYSMY